MNAPRKWNRLDGVATIGIVVVAFLLYVRTMPPTVATVFDDSLEFALVAVRWAIPHQTGYPLYAILIGLAARLNPFGEIAWRVHLVSALAGAATVGLVVLIARRLRYSLAAALWAGITLATAGTFWEQARIAEVYTLHLLFVSLLLLTLLRWAEQSRSERGLPLWPALVVGLGLAHHRTILLWLPAVLLFVGWTDRRLLQPQREWLRPLAALLAPLLLYAYLPARAHVGSLDSTYRNTVAGFVRWVTASQYSVFLTEVPSGQTGDLAFYRRLLAHQFSWLTIALILVGMMWLARRRPRAWNLLMLGALVNGAFGATYRVSDVEVFWLPVVLVGALLAGAGVEAILRVGRSVIGQWTGRVEEGIQLPFSNFLFPLSVLQIVLLALLVIAHVPRWNSTWASVDLSDAWAAADFAEDTLEQPLPDDATVIGILGEMTLLRYWQEVHGMHPGVRTIAADTNTQRIAAVEAALAAGTTPLLTRPLPGAEGWALDALGPLIAVEGQPVSFQGTTVVTVSDSVSVAADVVPIDSRGPARQRVMLLWQVEAPPGIALKTSARLRTDDGDLLAQLDCIPVHDAYPSTAWKAGDLIADAFQLPALQEGTTIELVVYRAEDGSPLRTITVPAVAPKRRWEDPDVGVCAPAYRLE